MRPGFFVSPQRRGGAESTAEIIAPAIVLAPIQKAMPSPPNEAWTMPYSSRLEMSKLY